MGKSLFSRFLRNEDGNFAGIFAVAMVPMMAVVAGSVDFSDVVRNRTALQDSLDSALVRIALDSISNPDEASLEAKGQEFFNNNVEGKIGVNAVLDYLGVVTEADSSKRFNAKVTKQYKGSLTALLNGPITVDSSVVRQSGPNACMLALSPTAASAIDFNGTTNVTLDKCTIAANSKSVSSITRSGSASLSAECVQTQGLTSGIVSDPKTTLACAKAREKSFKTADPLASFVPPIAGSCSNLTVPGGNGNNWKNIYPGTYCNNNFTINGGTKVRFNSGTYIFKGTDLKFLGGAEVIGTDVTIYLYNGSNISIAANAIVSLSAPVTGVNAGILFYSTASNPVEFSFAGGAGQKLQGFIYNPAGTIDFQGNSGTTGDQCVRLIGNTIKLSGTAKMKVNCGTELGGRDIVTTRLIRFVE